MVTCLFVGYPKVLVEKLLAGELSFWDRPEAMWLILFIWAISGPILAWLFRGWLNNKSLNETEYEQGIDAETVPQVAN